MRRVAISAACALIIWMIALMNTNLSASQPQVSDNFSGSSLSGSARTASFSAPSRGGAFYPPPRSLAPGP